MTSLYTNTAYLGQEKNFLLKGLFASISRVATYIHSFKTAISYSSCALKSPILFSLVSAKRMSHPADSWSSSCRLCAPLQKVPSFPSLVICLLGYDLEAPPRLLDVSVFCARFVESTGDCRVVDLFQVLHGLILGVFQEVGLSLQ